MNHSTSRKERIARRVEASMLAAGLTPYKLATRAAIPRTTLLRQLAAATEFNVDQLYRIGQILGFTLQDLFTEVDEEEAAA